MSSAAYTEKVHPAIANVVSQWQRQLDRAKRQKEEVFARQARECNSYYTGPDKQWNQLMGQDYIGGPSNGDLTFKMHFNKAFEYVTIFGPSLYYTNPVRTVKPRAPVQIPGQFFGDPAQFQQLAMEEQERVALDGVRAILLEAYLNWTPSRYKLDVQSRRAVNEALIKGRGLLWTELTEAPDQTFRAVTSRFDSVDHLLIDPDAPSVDKAMWIAQKVVQPIWEVEREYGIKRGAIKGNLESQSLQADLAVDPDILYRRAAGYTSDLLIYWRIWSKMGIGGRIMGVQSSIRDPLDEIFGDYCYLVIAPTCDFPLNMPPDMVADPDRYDHVLEAAKWPIPFYVDNRWPFVELDFHPIPDTVWPMAPLLAARGELRFLNWVYSFLAGHLKNATRTLVGVKKSLSEEIKTAIISGRDLELVELEQDHGAITDAIQFLEHPEVNGDIWIYLQAVEKAFDKRVGLSELLYGADPGESQPRSAAESNIRNQAAGIRPDDMARQVEAWQADVAVQEAFASRYLLSGKDVVVCMGPLAEVAWNQYVFTLDTSEAFHQLEYRIESGTTLRPNKDYEVRQTSDAMTTLGPIFQQYAQATGDVRALNNLIADYCKSRDLDPNRYQLMAAPAPPMLPSAAPGQPTPQGDVQVSPASGQPELG